MSDVLHRTTESDPPFRNNAAQHRVAVCVIERFLTIENDFFDRAVLDGGGFSGWQVKPELIIC